MSLLALSEEAEGHAVNIGSGKEWSIKETLDLICKITNSSVDVITDEDRIRPSKSEVNRLIACNKKIKKFTNWSDEVAFEEGLQKTVEWIGNNLDKFNTTEYTK